MSAGKSDFNLRFFLAITKSKCFHHYRNVIINAEVRKWAHEISINCELYCAIPFPSIKWLRLKSYWRVLRVPESLQSSKFTFLFSSEQAKYFVHEEIFYQKGLQKILLINHSVCDSFLFNSLAFENKKWTIYGCEGYSTI